MAYGYRFQRARADERRERMAKEATRHARDSQLDREWLIAAGPIPIINGSERVAGWHRTRFDGVDMDTHVIERANGEHYLRIANWDGWRQSLAVYVPA